MDPFWIVVASFAAGCVIGVFIAVATRRDKGARALEQELLELRQEYDNYRVEVGNHFVETSNLINQMTQSYRDVHQHLSQGAQNLCDPDLARQLSEETAPLIEHTVESTSSAAATEQEAAEAAVAPTEGDGAEADESELQAGYDATSGQVAPSAEGDVAGTGAEGEPVITPEAEQKTDREAPKDTTTAEVAEPPPHSPEASEGKPPKSSSR